jgi:S-formylglutathione hydrolase FrmB
MTFGGLQIDAHYGYVPTIGDLLGAPLPGQVSAKQLPDRSVGHSSSAALAGSVSHSGVVASVDIPASVSRFHHRAAFIWVPPIAFSDTRDQLPVLMLISGTPGAPDDWVRAGGALSLANRWAARHGGVAPILVMPDANGSWLGDTECVDGPRGNAETYLTIDVRRYVHHHFGVSLDPHHWAIGGLSEGGTCALDLAARHPNLFSTFADFSGDLAPTLGSWQHTRAALYGGSADALHAHDPTKWFPTDAAAGVEGVFAVGSADHSRLREEQHLAQLATADGMNIHVDVISGGGHNYHLWAHALRDSFAWIVARLGQHAPSAPVSFARGPTTKPHES